MTDTRADEEETTVVKSFEQELDGHPTWPSPPPSPVSSNPPPALQAQETQPIPRPPLHLALTSGDYEDQDFLW